ncbi:2OG-Fe(II) oxygenase [Bacteriovoracaceae bacterium]|nr:2OG-Fe(II) oxygenase [Bacteriovoracaceae bacterium]
MGVIDLNKYKDNIELDREKFVSCDPYPCVILDDFLDEEAVAGVDKEILELSNKKTSAAEKVFHPFIHINAKVWGTVRKQGFTKKMENIVSSLQTPSFLEYLENLTGVRNLIADKELKTGGYVIHKEGGCVNLHVDHRAHPYEKTWSRKVLLLLYFNENYQDEYNGHLELWDPKAKEQKLKVAPHFNRCVIQTIEDGYVHGLPEVMNFPEGDCRKALVLWYYVDEGKEVPLEVTKYYSRPQDSLFKKFFIHAENFLLYFHYVYKRLFNMDDTAYIRFLGLFKK